MFKEAEAENRPVERPKKNIIKAETLFFFFFLFKTNMEPTIVNAPPPLHRHSSRLTLRNVHKLVHVLWYKAGKGKLFLWVSGGPCIRLAHLKFELTSQNSAGGKTVLS